MVWSSINTGGVSLTPQFLLCVIVRQWVHNSIRSTKYHEKIKNKWFKTWFTLNIKARITLDEFECQKINDEFV